MTAFISRVYSQVYKNMKVTGRNYFRLFDVTIWPLILLFSIVLFVNYVKGSSDIVAMVLLGVTGWRAVYHFQIDMTTFYMEEYWSHSLNHFLVSPIRWIEFFVGNIITGIIKFTTVLILYLIIGYFFFSFTISNIPVFIFGILALASFGVILGLFTMGIIVIHHENAYTASYIIPDLLVLLSGVYYPISIFPQTMQNIIQFIPAVHGFVILKSTIGMAQPNYVMLFATSIVWLVCGLVLFILCLNYARKHGRLGRMS